MRAFYTDTDLHIYYVHIHPDNKKGAFCLVLLHVFVNKSITVILIYTYHFFLRADMHGNAEHVLVVLFSKCGTDYTYTSIHFRPPKKRITLVGLFVAG